VSGESLQGSSTPEAHIHIACRSTEMAFGAPFLLHLGISKSNLAFVFIAGPLSGLLVQPIIGEQY
jgi:hypothetical protein